MTNKTLLILLIISFSLGLSAKENILPELEGMDGKYHAMSEYIGKGKWVLVNVWSPTCSWCVREIPKIQKFNQDNDGEIITLGVTVDYPSFEYGRADIVRAFLKETPLAYPVFLADLDSASELIGNRLVGIPQTTIFHPNGQAVARWAGDIELSELYDFIQNFDDYFQTDPFVEEGF